MKKKRRKRNKKKNRSKKIIISIVIIVLILIIAYVSILYINSKKMTIKLEKSVVLNINDEYYYNDGVIDVINGKIVSENKQVDTSKIGNYIVEVEIEDYFKKVKKYSYNITIVDNEAPKIQYNKKIETEFGKKVDLLNGVTASDNSNEEIQVNVEGSYDFNKSGTYTLYYVASDSSGNESREQFTLVVKEKKVQVQTPVNNVLQDKTFTTSKGFQGEIKNGILYINGVLIANKTYNLPSTYGGGLTSTTLNAFNNMKVVALTEGISLWISSGYRSYIDQKIIYNNYVARDGVVKADTYSARPGHSEHQSGLAFDVNIINDSFANTPEAIWIHNNCYKYGFILRYPSGKTNETGYKYEPWHLRYVGVDLATRLYNNGDWITLEDYFGITSSYQ